MALYLPDQHLAFEVVDDPCSAPVERDAFPGLTVVPITCRELANPELLDSLARTPRKRAGRRACPAGTRRTRHV